MELDDSALATENNVFVGECHNYNLLTEGIE